MNKYEIHSIYIGICLQYMYLYTRIYMQATASVCVCSFWCYFCASDLYNLMYVFDIPNAYVFYARDLRTYIPATVYNIT